MNQKVVPWLIAGAIVIVILLLGYFFYFRPGERPTAPTAPPRPPAAEAPAAKPPAPVPTPQAVTPQKPPAAPPMEQAAPGPEVTPPASKVTILPPLKAKEQFGLLVGKYRKYKSAAKMLARLKKHHIPGFIKRKELRRGPYEVWAGPFSTRPEAEAAEKSIRAMHRRTPTMHEIITPVPK